MNKSQQILISWVRWYQKYLSPDHSDWAKAQNRVPYCRHVPSCSQYMIEAIEYKWAVRGTIKGIWRICRCMPWNTPSYDPVISKKCSHIKK
jgi:putative membrane protein insertion efficiency factor